ncbi:hypothetical protein AVV44_gp073 [Cronobacter phage S13]|uniref:Uncharacterized protein n=1 Tax=Cronobacter phage LPCS28 TaxID=2924885 RepID=A0AAE9G9F0_9CAUD|nr:hypothetical protein AVV44_gp073 [Cronobacter phage S13]YP_010665924.1 hypothetical protein PQB73_gp100 [Cronobacter phage LPCS28]AIA64872.1 hypothetical protein S13_073 [Cronobacter phage S13]UNY47113.1 hypothetical protein EHEKIMEA_00231 [Cronobacter phage LPCS28]
MTNSEKTVLFLDIDGVLNSKKSLGVYGVHLSSDMVRCLNKIVKLTQCDVVLSSSWRSLFTLDMFHAMMFNQGMTYCHKIVGKTDNFSSFRGKEIQKYLDEHDYSRYCILDDETDMLESQKPFFIRTDWNVGLTDEDAEQAIKILGQINVKCKNCNGYGVQNDELCPCRDGIKR